MAFFPDRNCSSKASRLVNHKANVIKAGVAVKATDERQSLLMSTGKPRQGVRGVGTVPGKDELSRGKPVEHDALPFSAGCSQGPPRMFQRKPREV